MSNEEFKLKIISELAASDKQKPLISLILIAIGLLESMVRNQQEIIRLLEEIRFPRAFRKEDWALPEEVLEFLGISERTLRRRKADESIETATQGGITYYSRRDMLKLRNKYLR